MLIAEHRGAATSVEPSIKISFMFHAQMRLAGAYAYAYCLPSLPCGEPEPCSDTYEAVYSRVFGYLRREFGILIHCQNDVATIEAQC